MAPFILLAIFTLMHLAAPVPQIFTETYKTCEFKIAGKKVTVPEKVWTITNREFTLNFSLCKSVQNTCGNRSPSCLTFHNNNQQIDLFEFSPGEDDFTFVSSSASKCPSDPNKNYTVSLSFQCSDSIKPKPRLMFGEDDCSYEVIMMKPDCQPKCTELIDSVYLLDFRALRQPFRIETESFNFSVSLCGSNPNCPDGISVCDIKNTTIVPLAGIESQHFYYDLGKNELTARGRFKMDKVTRDVQVLLKCKWETDLSNPRYKKVQIQGKHYKFEVESSFGCVKLPHHSVCTTSTIDNFHYDLKGLNRTEGWEVSNVPEGTISLNICAPLKTLGGDCAEQHSQVCHFEQNYVNRGSVLSSLQASHDVIKAVLVSGSTCIQNPEFSYSTEITFKCSPEEKGPVFTQIKDCVLFLTWETPLACPVDVYKGGDCYINVRGAVRNLRPIHSDSDKVYPLSTDQRARIVYNLCGPIHEPCAGFNNVSFCLKGDSDVVLGWDSRELISETGRLRLELHGSACSNRAEVAINFVCTFETEPTPTQLLVLEDGCKFNVTVFTPLACVSRSKFKDCSVRDANLTYDLSPLTLKHRNYIVSDGDVDFSFNLCGPVVTGPGALCRGDSMFCWHNKTEMNIRHKYKSLGGVGRPILRNGSLVLEGELGGYCEGHGHYKSVIHFECSKEKFAPSFLSMDECVYNFGWKTPEACPSNCLIPGSKPDVLDLTSLPKKDMKINLGNGTNRYEFNLCSDFYTKTTNGQTNEFSLNREYVNDNQIQFLVLDLKKPCQDTNSVNKIVFEIECSLAEHTVFQKTGFADCVLNMTVATRLGCLKNKKPVVVPKLPQKIRRNCTVMNAQTGYVLALDQIRAEEILFNRSTFLLNFDGSLSQCSGFLCRNKTEIGGNACPSTTFEYSYQRLVLRYSSQTRCTQNSSYEVEIRLKCTENPLKATILKDENCKTVISYDLREACYLLKQDVVTGGHAKTAVIAGSLTSIAILGGIAVIIYLNRRRCSYYIRYIPFYKDKTAVPIYCRDFTQ